MLAVSVAVLLAGIGKATRGGALDTRHGVTSRVALVAALAASMGLSTVSPAAATSALTPDRPGTGLPVEGTIFVANQESANGTGSVTEYTFRDSGNVHPVMTISKGIYTPYGLAFDASGDLWVANYGANTVVEYTKSELAEPSPAPSVIISSNPGDRLKGPAGLAFDSSGNLWVDNNIADSIIEYSKAELSASGSPPPRLTITDAGLFAAEGPFGLAFDPSGDLWVEGSPNGSGDAVSEYLKAQLARSGPFAPRATISPGYQLWDFTFDSRGNLWIPDWNDTSVLEYTKTELAKSGSPPARVTISGPMINEPEDLAFDPAGDLWVLDTGDGALLEYTSAELIESGSPTPAHTIKGAATGLAGPNYFAIEP